MNPDVWVPFIAGAVAGWAIACVMVVIVIQTVRINHDGEVTR